jgi:hypothetical protein
MDASAGPDFLMQANDGVHLEEYETMQFMLMMNVPRGTGEIAARASAAPGPGGKPLNMPIEVREVMSACAHPDEG